MLNSRVEEGEGRQDASEQEYRTASELFDLMATNHPFETANESLTTRDLVILYQNIDLGTKLMSDAEEYRRGRKPNRHVETVVYREDSDATDSEAGDVRAALATNEEQLDFIDAWPSLENTLCQKLGDLEIQTSNLSFQYDQHFLFKDPYIKEQLKNMSQIDAEFEGTVLPASLLDYICCKRLEDNYNFYMDNIIRYVKHTIDQLKRISNGDYLTDRAKEKWREVEDVNKDDENTKVLATSTSIPLQVETKVNGLSTTWDDIIHSEVDLRSLSKILEKKIVLEVPQQICESYKLFSKLCSDKLMIRCKREEEKEDKSRVDVVLQLGRSKSGQVVSNISSIMIVQPTPSIIPVDFPKVLPLPCTRIKEQNVEKKRVTIIEIPEIKEGGYDSNNEIYNDNFDDALYPVNEEYDINGNKKCISPIDEMEYDINFFNESKANSAVGSGDSSINSRDVLDKRPIPNTMRKEAPYDFVSPEDLSLSMHKFNMSALPEETSEDTTQYENNKKKLPTKIRVKSPYENKSYIMEEKKRKKLLEIREKREKKKMAMGENSKITKHRYGKGIVPLQPTSSVTKLSITNKSFYNSIYGHNMSIDKQSAKSKGLRGKKELAIDTPLDQLQGELESPMLTDRNSKKYINRSYYLDEAVTEVMLTGNRQSECSSGREGPASAVSAEFRANMNIISQLTNLPTKEINTDNNSCEGEDCFDSQQLGSPECVEKNTSAHIRIIKSSRSLLNVPPPANSIEGERDDIVGSKSLQPSVECRQSIDKLYELMEKIGKVERVVVAPSRSKLYSVNKCDSRGAQEYSTVQGSDSGTSLKHQLTSSNASSFSFEKINADRNVHRNTIKDSNALTTIVPKVIINTKQQAVKIEKKKVAMNSLHKVADNPLKAISQLLHEFDSVQKTRHKTAPTANSKTTRKPDTSFEARSPTRPGSLKKGSNLEPSAKELIDRKTKDKERKEGETNEPRNVKVFFAKDKKPSRLLNSTVESLKFPHPQTLVDRATKKKIADILDEMKEAKGEAVRGPAKPNTRLNTLAQPKKSYVQAHSEEYQTKYGRNLMADRLQRLASASPSPPPGCRPRLRSRTEALLSATVRPPPAQLLERGRTRRSANSSPESKAPDATGKQCQATDAAHATKDNIVPVESYVTSLRCSSPTSPTELLKARVPLVPINLDISSDPSSIAGEESAAIGNRLRHMISLMNPKPPCALSALVETHEVCIQHSFDKIQPLVTSVSCADERSQEHSSSVDSDNRADIFEDKCVKTAVQYIDDKRKEPGKEVDSPVVKYDRESRNSSVELKKIEEALCGRTPMGTFQKRLRINKLTLTPKSSMRQLMTLESGDAGSIILKSTLSTNLNMSSSHSDNEIRKLANVRNAHLDLRLTKIPVQVATVGYAFPEYNTAFCGKRSPIKSLDNTFSLGIAVSNISAADKTSSKISKCMTRAHEATIQPVRNTKSATPTSLSANTKQFSSASIANTVHDSPAVEMNRGRTNVSDVNKSLERVEEVSVKTKRDNVDCTSSLDMLVGILNEIQKITTCHITNTEVYADEQECSELATLLNNEAVLETTTTKNNGSYEMVSIGSLDKLRQLESSPSIYSLYVSNDDKESIVNTIGVTRINMSAKSVLCNDKPECVDKEVNADFPVREFTDTFTDAPSKIFPITVTHSTNVTNSLVGILSKSSSQTLTSLREYDVLDSKFSCHTGIIKVTDKSKPYEIVKNPIIEYCDKKQAQKFEAVADRKIPKVRKVVTDVNLFSDQNNFLVKNDPMMKVKRDILVTVYSMLVLTVFAALSFPGIMYHV